jgi:hypothetical protein
LEVKTIAKKWMWGKEEGNRKITRNSSAATKLSLFVKCHLKREGTRGLDQFFALSWMIDPLVTKFKYSL